ncbi:MAG: methylene-tetrahydromethanopterin dehydrogenase N-terminal domain-containing protein [Planctomycetota bacterium]
MTKRILVQIDGDATPSVFDGVVAVDSDVDFLFRHHGIDQSNVTSLVHGAIFTRGGDNLKNTAIFVGGSNVSAAEATFAAAQKAFFGPMRVSIMMDANGCNTTAAAAVVCAKRHVDFQDAGVLVLGGTGPVGLRVASMAASAGARVFIASRSESRAAGACDQLRKQIPDGNFQPASNAGNRCDDVEIVFGCGAAGATLMDADEVKSGDMKMLVDLNAVPPSGIQGVDAMAAGVAHPQSPQTLCYGAIGVGGLKMKVHRAAIRHLFTTNDAVLDASEICAMAIEIDGDRG